MALVDEPAIGLFDLALALSAASQMEFEDMSNMSVSEIDALVDHAKGLIHGGHLSPFRRVAVEPGSSHRHLELDHG